MFLPTLINLRHLDFSVFPRIIPKLLLRLSMTPILMSILPGLLEQLSLSLDLLMGFCSPGHRRGSCCPDLTALAQLGLSLRVQLGERKTCTWRKRSDRPFTERWTLSVRMLGSTFPCRQHYQSEGRRMKWTLLLTQRFPRPLLSAAIVSLNRHLAWAVISAAETSAVGKWALIADSSFW